MIFKSFCARVVCIDVMIYIETQTPGKWRLRLRRGGGVSDQQQDENHRVISDA